eukprot:GHUV01006491.1.p1 GENE.GHUV01006491.1~~GHUV01006491.1.p1  ORF type:complete len:285 (+),score=46.58 GHUV01006491.1:220-1074(+)
MHPALTSRLCKALRPPLNPCNVRRHLSLRVMASADMYPHGLKSLSPDTAMAKTLARLGSKFEIVPLPGDSAFVQPASIHYELDGKQRRWDIIKAHSSVACVLYHTDMDAFLVVRQFRPAVYAHRCREAEAAGQPMPDKREGFTIELCAGLIDKAKTLEQIVVEEIHEEVGYAVSAEEVRKVSKAVAAAGNNGADSRQFYAEINDSRRVNAGGGLEQSGEAIEVLALPFQSVPAFVTDDSIAKSTGLMFGLFWAYTGLLNGDLKGQQGKVGVETGELHLRSVLPS